MNNVTGEPARCKTITLYSSAHVMSACRECEVSLGIARNGRKSEVCSLIGVALRPDEAEPARWILTNGSGHPVYVQHPSFTSPVVKVNEGVLHRPCRWEPYHGRSAGEMAQHLHFVGGFADVARCRALAGNADVKGEGGGFAGMARRHAPSAGSAEVKGEGDRKHGPPPRPSTTCSPAAAA